MGGHLSRRGLLACACSGAAGVALLGGPLGTPGFAATGAKTNLTAAQALALLKEGNQKFVSEGAAQPVIGRERRLEIASGQAPYAVLVGCSDSRVAPEHLFGRGLGELFIIRNAGNTVDTVALGSIQYAVAELGVPLILVLGHERCGAVGAAVSVVKTNTNFPGSIGQMIEPIVPAVLKAQSLPGDLVENAVRENVRRVVARLRTSADPILLDPVKAGKLKIVGARYDLDDGNVDFFDEG